MTDRLTQKDMEQIRKRKGKDRITEADIESYKQEKKLGKSNKGPKRLVAGGAAIRIVGAIARGVGKKVAKNLAKQKAKKSPKVIDEAKELAKRKKELGGTSRKKGKIESYIENIPPEKLEAALGPVIVGSTVATVKGKEFADSISEDIAKAKRKNKPKTATFMRKSKKYQQKTANFADGGMADYIKDLL